MIAAVFFWGGLNDLLGRGFVKVSLTFASPFANEKECHRDSSKSWGLAFSAGPGEER